MILSFQIDNQIYKFDDEKPLNISIPLKFNDEQPNAYGVDKASSSPCKAGELVGDTRKGGSCNFEQYTFIPHCNGSHTECIGHITNERISVNDCLQDAFILANLITVEAEGKNETNETYSIDLHEKDRLITRKSIQNSSFNIQNFEGLIIRTLPNDESKLTQEYGEYVPPFFSNEAMDFIIESGIKHLLVDLPSIDRIFDEGKLSNHRKFWKIETGKFDLSENSRKDSTISEFIYVPNKVKDGKFLLNLQIAAFHSDVSPNRPIIFKIY